MGGSVGVGDGSVGDGVAQLGMGGSVGDEMTHLGKWWLSSLRIFIVTNRDRVAQLESCDSEANGFWNVVAKWGAGWLYVVDGVGSFGDESAGIIGIWWLRWGWGGSV
jgi:hypothetical protein